MHNVEEEIESANGLIGERITGLNGGIIFLEPMVTNNFYLWLATS
jgi:hypothetical protein